VSYRGKRFVVIAALAPALLVGGCNGENGMSPLVPSSGDTLSLEDLVSSASVAASQGVLRQGFPPRGGSGPSVMLSGNQTVVNGGTVVLDVTGDAPFSQIIVTLAGKTQGITSSSDSGLGSYFEVTLPSPQTSASLLLAFPQELPTASFDMFVGVVGEGGAAGPFAATDFRVIQVGTGDIQVTLSWDADSDVDLHVVDPNGEEVYFANTEVSSGGNLDLDSNAGCSIDDVRNENITWPTGSAPRGTYTVRVDYWSSCDVAETNYTVLVNNGGNVEVFSGTFTGPGDRGGLGSGVLITTFERTTGPASVGRLNQRLPEGPTQKR